MHYWNIGEPPSDETIQHYSKQIVWVENNNINEFFLFFKKKNPTYVPPRPLPWTPISSSNCFEWSVNS